MFQYRSLKDNQDTVYLTYEQPSRLRGRRNPFVWGIAGLAILMVIVILAVTLSLTVGDKSDNNNNNNENKKVIPKPPAANKKSILVIKIPLDCGVITGTQEQGGFVFKGIPYAEAPVSSLRWKPPQKRITGCDQDYNFKSNVCLQYTKDGFVTGSEDCLYLNVWSPRMDFAKNESKLPVMVWFHDGGLVKGSGYEIEEHPSVDTSKNLSIVFVSFNYRLGPFGFMHMKELINGSHGNFGLMDQIMALEWVRDNIGKFGGDRNKVTVFGEEAGATCIYSLLAAPKAKGLFHKAWISGFSPVINTTLEQAHKHAEIFLQKSFCNKFNTSNKVELWKCLELLRPNDVMDLMWQYLPEFVRTLSAVNDLPEAGETMPKLIVIDGTVLPSSPLDLWSKNQTVVDVPLLVGNEALEVDDYPTPPNLEHWNWTMYEDYIKQKLEPIKQGITAEVLQYYPQNKNTISGKLDPEYQMTSMITEVRAICPTDEILNIASQTLKSPIYRYILGGLVNDHIFEAFLKYHAYKYHHRYAFRRYSLYGFFGFPKDFFKNSAALRKAVTYKLRNVIRQFVVHDQILTYKHWQPYPRTSAVLSWPQTDLSKSNYNLTRCQFWKNSGFVPKYAWQT